MALEWDHAAALERVGGDEALLGELVTIFFEEYPKFAKRLSEGLERQDFAGLRETAHALKGSLGCVGASQQERLAMRLEQTALAKDGVATEELVRRLIRQIAELELTMRKETMHPETMRAEEKADHVGWP